MAEVWMARRQAMGGASKAVAVKLLASHLSESPSYRRMFAEEARLAMMMTHSNIVQVFDAGEQGRRKYMAMEWVDGTDLSQLAGRMCDAGERLGLRVIVHIIAGVLRGLAYAHGLTEGDASRSIIHHDVSPHNVLLSVSGEVKLSDFGVARLAGEDGGDARVRGKLRYMPPEQLRGESRHATTDLFAVGAMLQELLDGVRFRGGVDHDELFSIVDLGEVPPLRRAVPAELRAVRDGLLAPERAERIQTAGEALALLRRWSGFGDATDELAELVRAQAGIAAPRSGLFVSEDELDELEQLDEPTVCEDTRDPGSRTMLDDPGGQASALGLTAIEEDAPRAPRFGERRRAPALLGVAVALLGAALGFGCAWLEAGEVGEVEPISVGCAGS